MYGNPTYFSKNLRSSKIFMSSTTHLYVGWDFLHTGKGYLRFYPGIENVFLHTVSRDHRLPALGKPRDAKRRCSVRMFLSYPHTHDGILLIVLGVDPVGFISC